MYGRKDCASCLRPPRSGLGLVPSGPVAFVEVLGGPSSWEDITHCLAQLVIVRWEGANVGIIDGLLYIFTAVVSRP